MKLIITILIFVLLLGFVGYLVYRILSSNSPFLCNSTCCGKTINRGKLMDYDPIMSMNGSVPLESDSRPSVPMEWYEKNPKCYDENKVTIEPQLDYMNEVIADGENPWLRKTGTACLSNDQCHSGKCKNGFC